MATPSVTTGEPVARKELQALTVHGFGSLDAACYLLGRIEEPAGARKWLTSRLDAVSDAVERAEIGLNIAFTCAGLARLGLPSEALAGFSREYREGMVTENRRRILGDLPGSRNDPDRWAWGGRPESEVHVLLLLYAAAEQSEAIFARERRALESSGITIVTQLNAMLLEENKEHFGFRDGIAQPAVESLRGEGPHAIRPGELLLGHPNEAGLVTPSPRIASQLDGEHHLPNAIDDSSLRDLGINGSYLVFRQLEQDVPGFWNFLAEEATGESGVDHIRQVALAAKMVGRSLHGVPLVFDRDELSAEEEEDPAKLDSFGYAEHDQLGLRCPIGAHIRRTNPRDVFVPGDPEQSVVAVKRHRMVRRGRPFGSPADASVFPPGLHVRTRSPLAEGGDRRGLHFLCLVADLEQQFEFPQQTWVQNPKFGGLYEDPDPLLGAETRQFVAPDQPVRTRLQDLPQFVTVLGGAYFFLPSIRALHFLGSFERGGGG